MLDDYVSYMFAINRIYRATRPLQDFFNGQKAGFGALSVTLADKEQ
jgi:hypothetical protein